MADEIKDVPEHVHEAVRVSTQMHAEHHLTATPLTKWMNAITYNLGRPVAVVFFALFTTGWISINMAFPK